MDNKLEELSRIVSACERNRRVRHCKECCRVNRCEDYKNLKKFQKTY